MSKNHTDEKTQKTRPKKGEAIEIPVPPKSQLMRDFEKIATPSAQDEQEAGDKRTTARRET